MITHRRCGKTYAVLMDMLHKAMLKKDGRYAYIAPLRNQAKVVAWEMLKSFARPIQTKPPNEAELYIQIHGGSRIILFGRIIRILSEAKLLMGWCSTNMGT
jgi:hypothetical protein